MKIGIFGDRTPPLGELERIVLDHLWTHGCQTSLQVHAALADRRDISQNTVQTTLERLRSKRLLQREKQGRAYGYRVTISRDGLIARMVSDLLGALSSERDGVSIAGLLDLDAPCDEATLERLERWIDQQRKSPKESP
jgi:predicted transcriptional regulator